MNNQCQSTLTDFAERFNALHDAQFQERLACYIELFDMEQKLFANDSAGFILFCRTALRMSRNVVFKRKRCILLYQQFTTQVPDAVLVRDFEKLDALSQIRKGTSEQAGFDIERITALVSANDLAAMTTEDVRALVADTLGRKQPDDTVSPDSIKLPRPEQLRLAFDNDDNYRKLSCSDALMYGDYFVHHAFTKASKDPKKHTPFIKQAFRNYSELARKALDLLPEDERTEFLQQLSAE